MSLFGSVFRPLLFSLEPENAHRAASLAMKTAMHMPGGISIAEKFLNYHSPRLSSLISGLEFPNPVGLGAGFDKTGSLYPFLSHAGFGFVECGTFTALEQPGNTPPRVFRFPSDRALVNRMGFNNPGASKAAHILSKQNSEKYVPRGINIGKSKLTPLEKAQDDYIESVKNLFPYADYFTINVSSPNTPGLRLLQEENKMASLVKAVQKEIKSMETKKRRIPLFVKLAPDLSLKELKSTLDVLVSAKTDGIILTNTTLDRKLLPAATNIEGGLSGMPLFNKSNQVLRNSYKHTKGKIPIIGVGGIFSFEDALEKFLCGASLVQLYTGYIYEGPSLPSRIARSLDQFLYNQNCSLKDIIGSKK